MESNFNVKMIPVKNLSAHPDNPRKDLGDLTELAASIGERGVLQPLIVVPWFSTLTREPAEDNTMDGFYTIVAGHRRCAAAKSAGVEEIPCVVTDLDQHEQLETMLLENIQRSDLTYMEQAQGFQMMMDLGSTVEDLSKRTGFSKQTINHRLKILELDDDVFSKNRQIRMTDLIDAEAVEDMKIREELLSKYGGTSNFDVELQTILTAQTHDKCKKMIMTELNRLGVTKLNKTYYSAGVTVSKNMYYDYATVREAKQMTADDVKDCFYNTVNYCNYLILFRYEEPEVNESTDEEKNDYNEMRERRGKLSNVSEGLKEHVYDFIAPMIKKEPDILKENKDSILENTIRIFAKDDWSFDSTSIYDCFSEDVEDDENISWMMKKEKINAWFDSLTIEQMVLCNLYDCVECVSLITYGNPKFNKASSVIWISLFEILSTIGFNHTNEEQKLVCGTHESYVEA